MVISNMLRNINPLSWVFFERRIDVLLFRSGFARTINEARFFFDDEVCLC